MFLRGKLFSNVRKMLDFFNYLLYRLLGVYFFVIKLLFSNIRNLEKRNEILKFARNLGMG
jgi:succinate dehydrogenase/fumarate reductase cytochrome b subunit